MNPITTDILSVFPGLGGAFSSGRNDREHRANHVCTRRYCWDLLVLHRKPQWLNQKMQPWRGLRGFLESHWVWMPGPDPGASRGIPFSRPATALRGPLPRDANSSVFNHTIKVPFSSKFLQVCHRICIAQLSVQGSIASTVEVTWSLLPTHSSCSQERISLRSQ